MQNRYFSVKLHLHSCFEVSGSMAGHCFQAKKLGVDALWITDHDTRMCLKLREMRLGLPVFWGDDFERQNLTYPGKGERSLNGWILSKRDSEAEGAAEIFEGVSFSGARSMRIWLKSKDNVSDWKTIQVDLTTERRMHERSLLHGIIIKVALRPERGFGENGRVRICFRLSQQPPDLREEYLTYVFSGISEGDGYIPINLKIGEWNVLYINLTEDAKKYAKGGLDNVFGGISFLLDSRKGEYVELFVDDFQINQIHDCHSAYRQQKDLASFLSTQYGIAVFIGMELTVCDPHVNCLGSWIPIPNYKYSVADAVSYVRLHGGVSSINHPLSIEGSKERVAKEGKEQFLESIMRMYLENNCYGADLIEVGLPEGGDGFSLQDYLKLWDYISRAGIRIVGVGASDSHNNREGWEKGNNFVNWVRADALSEKDILYGLKSGDVYMADPIFFRGKLEFTTVNGFRMGQIVNGKDYIEVKLSMTGCKPGWKVRWIVNGEVRKVLDICDEKFDFQEGIDVNQEFNFTRFEVYNELGRCILLTNPIYFVG